MDLRQRLAGLELVVIPIWVYELETRSFLWANPRGLELWRAQSLDEFCARDLSDISEAAYTRLVGVLRTFQQGGTSQEDWTFYPLGKPVTMTVYCAGLELDDGRLAFLAQAVDKQREPNPLLVRGIEALRHSSVIVSLLAPSGAVLMNNPAAMRAFRDEPASAWFVDVEAMPALLRATDAREVFTAEVLVRTPEGERWHAVEARPTADPVTGEGAILVHQTDVTSRRHAEHTAEVNGHLAEELRQSLTTVEEQRREILALSAPILELANKTLALPIIGALNPERSAEIAARLLRAIAAQGAESVVLDLTGAYHLDAESAGTLTRLVQAVRLLGARAIVTGMRPELARPLVERGVDLSGILMLRSLREGLAACRRPGRA